MQLQSLRARAAAARALPILTLAVVLLLANAAPGAGMQRAQRLPFSAASPAPVTSFDQPLLWNKLGAPADDGAAPNQFEDLKVRDEEQTIVPRQEPSCTVQQIEPDGERQRVVYSVEDSWFGLASVQVTRQDNVAFEPAPDADGWIDGFTPGITETVKITATQVDLSVGGYSALRVTNTVDWVVQCTSLPEPAFALATSAGLPRLIAAQAASTHPLPYSFDGGICWQQALGTEAPNPVFALAPREDGTPRFLLLDDHGVLHRSGDFGASWASESVGKGLSFYCNDYCAQKSLEASPAAPAHLYAALNFVVPDLFGSAPYAYLFRSTDAGVSWQMIELPARGSPFSTLTTLVPSPLLPEEVYIRISSSSGCCASAWYKSDDGGATWGGAGIGESEQLALDWLDAERLYAYSPGDDQGYRLVGGEREPWLSSPGCSGYQQFLAGRAATGKLFLRCSNGLFVSQDGGDQWTKVSNSGGQFLVQDFGSLRMLWLREDGVYTDNGSGLEWHWLASTNTSCSKAVYLPSIQKVGK